MNLLECTPGTLVTLSRVKRQEYVGLMGYVVKTIKAPNKGKDPSEVVVEVLHGHGRYFAHPANLDAVAR